MIWTWLQRYLSPTTAHSKGPDDKLGLEHTHTFLVIYLSTYIFIYFHGTSNTTWKQWKGVCITINLIPCFRNSTFSLWFTMLKSRIMLLPGWCLLSHESDSPQSPSPPIQNQLGMTPTFLPGGSQVRRCEVLCLLFSLFHLHQAQHNSEGP